jgi:hypothetical protein
MDLPKWLGNLCPRFGYKDIYIKKERAKNSFQLKLFLSF